MKHSGEAQVGGVRRLAARPGAAVDARCGPADDRLRTIGPLVERVLLDQDPLLGEGSLDLLLGLDQPRQERIASSIFGYVPQRQRFPAIRWRISSRAGSGLSATSAAAETI